MPILGIGLLVSWQLREEKDTNRYKKGVGCVSLRYRMRVVDGIYYNRKNSVCISDLTSSNKSECVAMKNAFRQLYSADNENSVRLADFVLQLRCYAQKEFLV